MVEAFQKMTLLIHRDGTWQRFTSLALYLIQADFLWGPVKSFHRKR